jgi:hypothetical protein
VPICLACLTVVSFPLDLGEERKARHEAAALAPHFWEEGLAESLRSALERAQDAGVDRAAEAIRELDDLGARPEVVTAVVLRLAGAQVDEMRARR